MYIINKNNWSVWVSAVNTDVLYFPWWLYYAYYIKTSITQVTYDDLLEDNSLQTAIYLLIIYG